MSGRRGALLERARKVARGNPFRLGALEFLFAAGTPEGVRSFVERWREDPAGASRVLCIFLEDPQADPVARAAAVSALGDFHERSIAPQVIPLLADPDATVRNLAGWALGRLGDCSLVSEIAPMLESNDWGTRRAAVLALSLLRAEGCRM